MASGVLCRKHGRIVLKHQGTLRVWRLSHSARGIPETFLVTYEAQGLADNLRLRWFQGEEQLADFLKTLPIDGQEISSALEVPHWRAKAFEVLLSEQEIKRHGLGRRPKRRGSCLWHAEPSLSFQAPTENVSG